MPRQSPQPLTPNEKKVLEFIEGYMTKRGFAPSYQEIKDHFDFASFNSVQRYLKQLESKGYIHSPGENKKRAIVLLHPSSAIRTSLTRLQHKQDTPEALALPLLGRVAAGQPIEEFEHNEVFDVPSSLVRQPQKTFALKVKGQSMVDDGILDGDVILVQEQTHASNGEIVVAMIEDEATVKHYYSRDEMIELRPANTRMKSMWFAPDKVKIQGVVVGLIRKF